MNDPEITNEQLADWVIQSFWLDLAYDEENPELVAEVTHLPETERKAIQTRQDRPSLGIADIPSKNAKPQEWFKCLLQLKAVRVRDCLEFDATRLNLAKSASNEIDDIVEVEELRKANLDRIFWRCCAAIDSILGFYENKLVRPQQKTTWATLMALYYTELCASAPPGVSYGYAQRSTDGVKDEAVGVDLFKFVARHVEAVGLNHLLKPLDAARTLDRFLDDFVEASAGEGKSNISKIKKSMGRSDDAFVNFVYRTLYFPAIRTMSQSLFDLGRHAERRFYLVCAIQWIEACSPASSVNELEYWNQVLALERDLADLDTGVAPRDQQTKPDKEQPERPRVRQLRETAQFVRWARSIDETAGTGLPDSALWLLRWHAAEGNPRLQRIEATCKALERRINVAQGKKADEKGKALAILTQIHGLLTNIENQSGFSDGSLLKGTLKKTGPERERRRLWLAAVAVFKSIDKATETLDTRTNPNVSDESGLREWRTTLEKLMKDTGFLQFRSEAEAVDVLPIETQGVLYCRREEHALCGCCASADMNDAEGGQFASKEYRKSVMSAQEARFLGYLKSRTGRWKNYRQGEVLRQTPNFELVSLRRWNSFSPNLGSRASVSVGGGYLVRAWTGEHYVGVAIDPGYNFLENLFNEGFTISDIDVVMITHAHPDHTENLTNLFTLLFERNRRLKKEEMEDSIATPREHRISLAMTEGVFSRFQPHLRAAREYIRDIVVLKAKGWRGSVASEQEIAVCVDAGECRLSLGNMGRGMNAVFSFHATRAWHIDNTDHDSIGVVITREDQGCHQRFRLGVLGDTRYREDLHTEYRDCNVIVAHLGSLVRMSSDGDVDDYSREKMHNLLYTENHLYLPGLRRLICDLSKQRSRGVPIVVLSEFGEELRGGLRADLARRLSFSTKFPVVPADVGLRIDIAQGTVFCSLCHRYVEPKMIDVECVMPGEEALGYVCKDCGLLRKGELPKLLEEWCTTGRPVIPLDESRLKQGRKPEPAG